MEKAPRRISPITFIMSMHYQPNLFIGSIIRLNHIILDLKGTLRRGNRAKVQLCCKTVQQ